MTMLKSVPLGSGLRVSQLCLGTMNFGQPGQGRQGDWTLDTDQARPIFRSAIDHGLFYFDCADAYGQGAAETVVGRLLKELLPRDEYVLQTKVAMPMGPGANQGGLSRKHIIEGVDASLRRLGHDYVDVLVIHRHPHALPGQAAVPLEETLEALHDVVRAGKALYLGASSMFAWQFAELQLTARLHGWTGFVAMQNHYNLIYREEEREMNPYCVKTNVALTPWSPLARGVLTGSYRADSIADRPTAPAGRTGSAPQGCTAAGALSRLPIGSARWHRSTAPRVLRWASPGCWASREWPLPWSAYRGRRRSKTWPPEPPSPWIPTTSTISRHCTSPWSISCRSAPPSVNRRHNSSVTVKPPPKYKYTSCKFKLFYRGPTLPTQDYL